MTLSLSNIHTVNIEPTNYCPLHCSYCGDIKTRKIGFIKLDTINKIMEQIPKNVEIRLFMSGEPLCHPDIDKIIEEVNKYNNNILIHSNGVYLSKKLSEKLVNSALKKISFSFDGVTKEEYERNRFGANFEYVYNNINNFLRINNYRIHTTIQMLHDYPEKYKEKELKQLFPEADDFYFIYKHSWIDKNLVKKARPSSWYTIPCEFTTHYLSFLWNGDAVACCGDLNGRYIVGNIFNQSVEEIWNSDKFTFIRGRQIQKLPIPELCSLCERYPY